MQSNDSNKIDKEQSDILSNGSAKMVDIVELKEEKEEKEDDNEKVKVDTENDYGDENE